MRGLGCASWVSLWNFQSLYHAPYFCFQKHTFVFHPYASSVTFNVQDAALVGEIGKPVAYDEARPDSSLPEAQPVLQLELVSDTRKQKPDLWVQAIRSSRVGHRSEGLNQVRFSPYVYQVLTDSYP